MSTSCFGRSIWPEATSRIVFLARVIWRGIIWFIAFLAAKGRKYNATTFMVVEIPVGMFAALIILGVWFDALIKVYPEAIFAGGVAAAIIGRIIWYMRWRIINFLIAAFHYLRLRWDDLCLLAKRFYRRAGQ